MSKLTNLLHLIKPDPEEKYNVADFNMNTDILESAIKNLQDKNTSQDNLLATKSALESESKRAKESEGQLLSALEAEVTRATNAENSLDSNKVDKISGKGLSTNDYTTSEKEKLSGIASGAQVNIQSDWNITDTSSDAYIKNKPSVYSKNEIDNKFSALETNIDWKESVATYDDIATTYPTPQDGWTVNVKDTDYTYRYNGTDWVVISANAIPKATNSVDGLLSKEDHANYEDAYNKRHTHDNKSVLDGITSTLIENWNAAKIHADSGHARTDATKVTKSTTNGNILINDTETNVYTHPDGTNPHGTTKSDVGLSNVENKSSATIRSELTKENVTIALGYTPPTANTTYGAAGSGLGLIKSGGDLTISNGVAQVNDDSHNHVIGNIDGLQTALDGKASSSHAHSSYVNQNAFSNIKVGSVTISADTVTDTVTLVAGDNIILTPDAANDKITISSSGFGSGIIYSDSEPTNATENTTWIN